MRLLFSTGLALTAAIVAAGPGIDLAAAPNNRPPRDIKVSVTLHDNAGDRIQSDGGSTYEDGVDGVLASINLSHGTLGFGTLQDSATRTLQFFFDPLACLSPGNCKAPWPMLKERAGLQGNVLRDGVVPAGGLMAMTTDEGELPMWIKFDIPLDSDPAYWNVCFDSRKVIGPCAQDTSNTSTDARIRRIASDEWEISANSTDRGDLIKDTRTKNTRTYTSMGTYSMPFTMTVKCLNTDTQGNCI
jgi:hypothetical protein